MEPMQIGATIAAAKRQADNWDFAGASESYTAALALDPRCAEARAGLVAVLDEVDSKSAEGALDLAVGSARSDPELAGRLAAWALYAGRYRLADQLASWALSAAPNDARGLAAKGVLTARAGNSAEAHGCLAALPPGAPESPLRDVLEIHVVRMHRGRRPATLQASVRAEALENRPAKIGHAAFFFEAAGNMKQVRAVLSQGAAKTALPLALARRYASALLKLRAFGEARAVAEDLCQRAGTAVDWLYLGAAEQGLRHPEAALAATTTALEMGADPGFCHECMGRSLSRMWKGAEAVKHFEHAISLGSATLFARQAVAFERVCRGRLREALRVLRSKAPGKQNQ